MSLYVQKFGGSSVANAEKMLHAAHIIKDTYEAGNDYGGTPMCDLIVVDNYKRSK